MVEFDVAAAVFAPLSRTHAPAVVRAVTIDFTDDRKQIAQVIVSRHELEVVVLLQTHCGWVLEIGAAGNGVRTAVSLSLVRETKTLCIGPAKILQGH